MCDFMYQTNLYSTLQNLIFKLEQWQVKVESTGRKVKILKLEDILLVFLDVESEDEWWKEENEHED